MNYHCSWSTRNGCDSPTTGTHKQIQECTVHHTVTMLCSALEPLQLWCINATLFCPFHPNSYLLRTRYSWFVTNIHIWSITHEKINRNGGRRERLCCSKRLAGARDVRDRPLPKHRETVLSCWPWCRENRRRRRMRKECGDGQIGHGVVWYEPIRVGHDSTVL